MRIHKHSQLNFLTILQRLVSVSTVFLWVPRDSLSAFRGTLGSVGVLVVASLRDFPSQPLPVCWTLDTTAPHLLPSQGFCVPEKPALETDVSSLSAELTCRDRNGFIY